ncbi:MAG TPA: phosphatidylserine decarboxylase family protein [Dissulfurispiraceae bacterium]|nr:phosphatidylserine decarboxylase family protein [Dissulfurispiraceae bacterium]
MPALAPEGYPFVVVCAVATSAALAFGGFWASLLPLAVTFFMVYFFRDPDRVIPHGESIFVSPADGKVILIERVNEPQYIGGPALMMSIFMSPLDVHVNRVPCDGVVESVVYTPGKFLSAFKHEASLQNENITMVLATGKGKIVLRQVAGFLARRAVCRAVPGDRLRKGDRYGIIKFSSRVDIYLPSETQVSVRLGDRVKAGESALGRLT